MEYHNPNENWHGAVLIIALLLCALLSSCKTKERIVTIETVRTDTTYITRHERDSIHVHDSIHVRERGDTVLIDRWHTQWRDRWRYDTIYIARHDTVPRPYPVIQEVPAQLSWWQQTRLHLANVLLWLVGLCCLIYIIRWLIHKKLLP